MFPSPVSIGPDTDFAALAAMYPAGSAMNTELAGLAANPSAAGNAAIQASILGSLQYGAQPDYTGVDSSGQQVVLPASLAAAGVPGITDIRQNSTGTPGGLPVPAVAAALPPPPAAAPSTVVTSSYNQTPSTVPPGSVPAVSHPSIPGATPSPFQFQMTAPGSNTVRQGGQGAVGDIWAIGLSGLTPGATVTVSGTFNGRSIGQSTQGAINANGNFVKTGVYAPSQAGTWHEDWYVAGALIGSVDFTVGAPGTTVGVLGGATGVSMPAGTLMNIPIDRNGAPAQGQTTNGVANPVGTLNLPAGPNVYGSIIAASGGSANALLLPSDWAYYYMVVTGDPAPDASVLGYPANSGTVTILDWFSRLQAYIRGGAGTLTGHGGAGFLGGSKLPLLIGAALVLVLLLR